MQLRRPLILLAGLSLAGLAVAKTKKKTHTPEPSMSRAASSSSLGGTFDIDRLPKGADVTIPRPATTLVHPGGRAVLTATDIPQTLSFKPVNGRSLKLSIYDPSAQRVQYVDLQPGTPFLYNFKDLGSITVLPEGSTSLQVESDKPLQIAH